MTTIKAKKVTETVIEIELPAYYQNGKAYYKILSQDVAIRVEEYDTTFGISKMNCLSTVLAGAIEYGLKITEEEFLAAFERVGEKVKRELIKAIETDQWLEQEKQETETLNA